MAWKVNKLIEAQGVEDQTYLVICGNGHMGYGFGVPERIFAHRPELESSVYMLYARAADHKVDISGNGLEGVFMKDTPASDVCFLYEMEEDIETVKEETAKAYNKVGGTAHIAGNLTMANKVMTRIGYSPEQIQIAGNDAYNYQGVGNPHTLAKLQPGMNVLDLGSGLGIDSIIAATTVTESGSVTGLDLSKMEVKHANSRAERRGLKHLKFVTGDMEKMQFENESFDAVISNGAFCLAPSKEAALREVFRVLRPGGRFSICTSVINHALEPGVKWPLCLRMFIHKDAIVPICEEIGFKDVVIDMSNSKMSFEDEEDEGDGAESSGSSERAKSTVHIGSEEFKHLVGYDMNEICARVVVTGRKP